MEEKKLKEILFDGDEVVQITSEKLDLTKIPRFRRKQISINEMIELLKKYPSLGFDAYQRLYAAIKMFGRTIEKNKYRWRVLDYPIIEQIVSEDVGPLYGIEKEFDMIVNYLKGASEGGSERARLLALFGDVGSGKTSTVRLLDRALSAYGTFNEGEVYTVFFDLNKLLNSVNNDSTKVEVGKFINERIPGNIRQILCPAHENPISTLLGLSYAGIIEEDINKIIDEINSREKYQWRKLKKEIRTCPHCEFIFGLLSDIKESFNVDVREAIRFVNLKTYDRNPEVKTVDFRIPDKRSVIRTEAFEGSIHMGRMAELGGNREHPLVLNFGLAGEIDKPSSQRGILHMTELLKSDQDMIKQLLDFVQDHTLYLGTRGISVYLDAVFISTSNLDELKSIRREVVKTIEDRMYKVVFPHPTCIDDVGKALKERVFGNVSYHIPPYFIERLLSIIFVLSTLEEPMEIKISDKPVKLNLVEKALLYNGEIPPGLEVDLVYLAQELKRIAESKSILERKEGIIGISMRLMFELSSVLRYEINKIVSANKDKYKPCVAILQREYPEGIRGFLSDFFKTYLKEEETETKKRIIEEILPLVFDPNEKYGLYLPYIARDVQKALVGEEAIMDVAISYVSMIRAIVKKTKRFIHPLSQKEGVVDENFLKKIEEYGKLSSSYRENFAQRFDIRLRERLKLQGDKNEKDVFIDLIKDLLKEERDFARAIEEYVIRQFISEKARDISSVYNPQNEVLVNNLIKIGYCSECASYAISVASELRRK
ncbi:MAG: hypothetical protein RMJ17_02330 [Candidatus Aenigmarchaeota archaeon]|nr:hypothetical protein [Candidatus Aenigmarchaeota archaeon]MDW8149409.1 hypothetical protein [Candidatus Aenigmarchaeota archaeon]